MPTVLSSSTSLGCVVGSLLLKVAMRCNIACTYCYWFRDHTVYDAPPLLTENVEAALIEKLERHLGRYELPAFAIMLHGGEPLLFGKRRFVRLAKSLRYVGSSHQCDVSLSVQTNGLLVDDEWAAILRDFNCSVGISLDGSREVHDRQRVDSRGGGTFDSVVQSVRTLQEHDIPVGLIAVCDPSSDPRQLLELFVDQLGVTDFNVLVPDATHQDAPASIARYYKALFDVWFDRYSQRGVRIRLIDSMLRGLLGFESGSESIGYGPVTTVTMLTDGSLEALDVCRITGRGSMKSAINIVTHDIQDIDSDPLWREILRASIELAPVCRSCELMHACGGGHIASRWSLEKGYENPSVYCADYKSIFGHLWQRVKPTLYLEAITPNPEPPTVLRTTRDHQCCSSRD
jgi:uncharacterized protein